LVWEEVHGTCWPEYTFLTAATASMLDSSCDSCDTTGNPASCHFGKPPLRTHTFSWPKTLNILHTTKIYLSTVCTPQVKSEPLIQQHLQVQEKKRGEPNHK
jgi:hypothetical protein